MHTDYYIYIIGNLSYLITAYSFLMRDMLHLRVWSIISALLWVSYFTAYAEKDLWFNAEWKIFIVLINAIQVFLLLRERAHAYRTIFKDQYLHLVCFSKLSEDEFKRILHVGKPMKFSPKHVLVHQGKNPQQLFIITKGKASVKNGNEIIAFCREGNFVGEMSFLTQRPATATVEALEPLEVVAWDQEKLRSFLKREPSIMEKMQEVFNFSLIEKLRYPKEKPIIES
jgi:CRP-like cAMP-binding protein